MGKKAYIHLRREASGLPLWWQLLSLGFDEGALPPARLALEGATFLGHVALENRLEVEGDLALNRKQPVVHRRFRLTLNYDAEQENNQTKRRGSEP